MNFESYPLLINDSTDINIVLNDLYETFQIPLEIISDTEHPFFKEVSQQVNPQFRVKYVIIVINYIQTFTA